MSWVAIVLSLYFSVWPFVGDTSSKKNTFTLEEMMPLVKSLENPFFSFDKIPAKPISTHLIVTYKDQDLTQEKGYLPSKTVLDIVMLTYNQNAQPIFKLSDGSYILASKLNIVDSSSLLAEETPEVYWVKADASYYEAPYTTGVKKRSGIDKAYQKVSVTEKVQTQYGIYAKISDKVWVPITDLSQTDHRMEAVQLLLNKKYNQSNLSIYVKQLQTDEVAEINADKKMYSASISKLPILYYTQRQITNGELQPTQQYQYIDAVNTFSSAYKPEGSTVLPHTANHQDYSIDDLEKAVAQESDNVASNMLAYYVTQQFDSTYTKVIAAVAGETWDMSKREVSAKMAGKMMEALYYQDGKIMDYLSHTEFDNQRIAKDISDRVAHKIGDAYDYKHDVAVVYSDSTFVLSIFTNESSYNEITRIANDIYNILK